MTPKDERYHDSINCKFSEAEYQKMASTRFGIEFCCELDLKKLEIAKELLNLNAIADTNLPQIIA